MSNDKDCPTVAACHVRFKCIDTKLEEMHSDMKLLSVKVSNGLSDRLNVVETDITLLQAERESREKRSTRIQTAFLSLMVVLSTAAILYGVKHFTQQPQQPSITQKP